MRALALLPTALLALACAPRDARPGVRLVFPGSAVGAEAQVLALQLARFEARHPGIEVEVRQTPDSADERHQLYVQWLAAGLGEPDVLQLDVIWIPELAAAGFILPLDGFKPDLDGFFPGVLAADRYEGRLFALPWFVDVGMLYWRTDLLAEPPGTFEALAAGAREAGTPYGLVLQGARYEGLVTVFQEVLGGFGGALLDREGRVAVDGPAGRRALGWLRGALETGLIPEEALTWQEERARFAFQNGQAAFMRNWPYAYGLMNDPERSAVAGRFAVAPMPAGPGGEPTASLGGSHLAVNARTRHPKAAFALVSFLTAPEQMLERARIVGQLPPWEPLYDDPRLARALPIPLEEARRVVRAARPRPVTPVYTALSQVLQVQLHRALTGQVAPEAALAAARVEMEAVLATLERRPGAAGRPGDTALLAALALAAAALAYWVFRRARREAVRGGRGEARTALLLVSPALGVIALVALFPLSWAFWESLHRNDLRMPWLGREWVGLANYLEAVATPRFWSALFHTALFTVATVGLELVLGLVLALALDRAFRGRGLVRAGVLIPWALPTVVAGLLWRYLFEGDTGVVNAALTRLGLLEAPLVWFGGAVSAWVPLILADVWKTTPFVALLLLAGLQGIDPTLYEAAKVDGAGPGRRLWHVTLPLLRPAILVALLFRSLDAFRLFDLVYVLTGGGPGTATEPVALYTWQALLQNLRFGYGSALSVLVFGLTFGLALIYVRLLGSEA